MLGAIVGDIVGSRFEFNNHRSKNFELFGDGCFATDDSIMTLAVAKAIMEATKTKAPNRGGYNHDFHASYNKYLEQSIQTRTLLGEWHDRQVKALRIDLEQERISKAGVEAIVSAPLGWLIDDKFNYKELKQSLAHEISTQANPTLGSSEAPKQVYDEDVAIIIKDGKYYYLPEASGMEY